MNKIKVVAGFLSIVLAMISCGGGGGNGSEDLSYLAGTWVGAVRPNDFEPRAMATTIDASGHVSQILFNGLSTGLTGRIRHLKGQYYEMALSDGTGGGFYLDNSKQHIFYLNEDYTIAVLQKPAPGLPAYYSGDIVGSWIGLGFQLNSNWDLVASFDVTTNVAENLTFTSTSAFNDTTGNLAIRFEPTEGWWFGSFTNDTMESGNIDFFLSADKSFIGGVACNNPGQIPTECRYFVLW